MQKEIEQIKRDLLVKFGLKEMVGNDPKFCEALRTVKQIAGCDVPVLLCGETGTGKELFARAIHYLSARSACPFIPVNSGAIPGELFENELFGHVKGAFTGASARNEGIIRAANGGTLFLDEIDSIPLLVQAKLLRFLEEKEFKPLGLNRILKADVRIVAAARGDLWKKVLAGAFRDDLFYRLNVISLSLPPLRERVGDIPLLAEHFLRKYSIRIAKPVTDFDPAALDYLATYNWPGNVRELENAIYHAVAVCQTPTIQAHDLSLASIDSANVKSSTRSFKSAKAEAVAAFERQFITRILVEHRGNISRAARAAHKHRRAFWGLMKKYGIEAHVAYPYAHGFDDA